MPGATISPVEAKIGQIIKDFSTESSFTAEAMKQFMELKAMVGEYEVQIKELHRDLERDKDKIGDLNSKIKTLEGVLGERDHEVEGWRARESELLEREVEMTRIEVTLACEKQRVEDHQSMVGLIFRNSEIRKVTLGQELSHQPGSPEMKNEYGTIIQYHVPAGFEATPVKKDESETTE